LEAASIGGTVVFLRDPDVCGAGKAADTLASQDTLPTAATVLDIRREALVQVLQRAVLQLVPTRAADARLCAAVGVAAAIAAMIFHVRASDGPTELVPSLVTLILSMTVLVLLIIG
jgi:hypothetical protein